MRRKWTILGWSLLLAGLAGCSDCGRKDKTLAELIPADVPGAVLFPDLAQTVGDIGALKKKFAVGPMASFIDQGHRELSRILGFDPLALQDLRQLGLEPSRGLALAPVDEHPVVLAGVSDRQALERELAARMKQLAAAEQVSSASHDGQRVTTIAAKVGQQITPRLHYALVGDYALLTWGKSDPKLLARMAGLEREQSLAGAAWYKELTGKPSGQPDVLLVANAPGPEVLGARGKMIAEHVEHGLIWTFAFDPGGIDTQVYLGLAPETATRMQALTAGVNDAHLERYLPADTLLALKLRANVDRLLEEAFGLQPDMRQQFDQAMQTAQRSVGADVEQGTVRNLTGNLVLGLSLGKPDQINHLLRQMADTPADVPPATGGWQAAFNLFGWTQVRDAAAWIQIIQNTLGLAAEQSGVEVDERTVGKLRVFALTGPDAESTFYLLHHDDLVGGCLGRGCADKAAALVAGEAATLPGKASPASKRLFEEDSFAVGYLSWARVVEALNALDASALGEGGMLAKMVLNLALTVVRNLEELTAVVRFVPGGVTLSSRLEIQ